VEGDNRVKLFVGSKLVVHKKTAGRDLVAKKVKLAANQPVVVKIEYRHAAGEPSLHVSWSGPGLDKTILTPLKGTLDR
jgi:hypothetical protein